jgi:hypothetical protein
MPNGSNSGLHNYAMTLVQQHATCVHQKACHYVSSSLRLQGPLQVLSAVAPGRGGGVAGPMEMETLLMQTS